MRRNVNGMPCGRSLEQLTLADREMVAEAYREGKGIHLIAKQMDITQKAVRQVLGELQVPLRRNGAKREAPQKRAAVVKEKRSALAVGYVIRKLRQEARWSLSATCAPLKIQSSRMEVWERGQCLPPPWVLDKLEALLGLPPGEIMRLADDAPLPFCAIPSQRGNRQVAEMGTCPSMFCCYCSDGARIPAACRGVCLPRTGDFDKCAEWLRSKCPCYSPATEERMREYREFMAQRHREEERFGKYRAVEEEESTD